MAETLLSAGAKVNVVDEYGETPLTLASVCSSQATVPATARKDAELARCDATIDAAVHSFNVRLGHS